MPRSFMVAAVVLLTACLDRTLEPLSPCLVSGVVDEVTVEEITSIDMLFVVDNSHSMRQEQAALRAQFPGLIEMLTTGVRPGRPPFDPVTDLRLGVVSTDLGLAGIPGVPGCSERGDDAKLLHAPDPMQDGCRASYPPFLSYRAGVDDPLQTARDFGCIASLGTDGCGFEQPLEAALRGVTESGLVREPSERSMVAVIVVTDEEDCSSHDYRHFTPPSHLAPDDPLQAQDLNLRCFSNPQNLHPIDRYVEGLRALRPGMEQHVVFGLIAGVPDDLTVLPTAADEITDAARDAHYATMLSDPRMQERVDVTRPPELGDNLVPSCRTQTGEAYPPRRLVEAARRFGRSGAVQSICQDDFSGAIDAIVDLIAINQPSVCLPRPLVRDGDGTVACEVVWEFPPPDGLGESPDRCEDVGLYAPTTGGGANERGGLNCVVPQIPVTAGTAAGVSGHGWYYDDFSEKTRQRCPTGRVTFADGAPTPPGVTVKLQCLDERDAHQEVRHDVLRGPDVITPTIGSPCANVTVHGVPVPRETACHVRLLDPTAGQDGVDTSMFCHPRHNVCVLGCTSDADCPPAWVCDDRPETRADTAQARGEGPAICVNPTCGDRAGMVGAR